MRWKAAVSAARTKVVEHAPYAASDETWEKVKFFGASDEAHEMTESEFEREIEVRMRELKRQFLQDHIDSREGGRAAEPVRDGEGKERQLEREHQRTLQTTFGPVEVERFGYGGAGLSSLHPLDGVLNLPVESYSLELRRRVALEATRGSFEETAEAIRRWTGVELGKRQVEELAQRAAADFVEFYDAKRAMASPPESAGKRFVVVSVDGKGVVMRKEDLREATRKAAEKRVHKLETRLSPGEKRNCKRIATVAVIYTVAPHVRQPEDLFRHLRPEDAPQRPRPVDKRVWASLEEEPEQVLREAFQEAVARDPEHGLPWLVLVDGQDHQLRLVKRLLRELGIKATIILDLIHVMQYVWKAGMAFHEKGTEELEAWVLERLLAIAKGRVSWVAAGMRRSATLQGLAPAKRKPVDRCAKYLLKKKAYMRYDEYLAAGYPVATGVVEGACRHLVEDRLGRTGARWSLTGAEAILRLRALASSGDFDDYWKFHEGQERRRNHAALYAEGHIPAVQSPAPRRRRSNFHVVK